MLIHKGAKYSIHVDGVEAVKTDGVTRRTMKFYPERDASAIAGDIDELTAWQILHDIAGDAQKLTTPIAPKHILIDGTHFVLSEWSEGHDERLTAPEGYSAVWALAASVFYLFLGCHVFQGLGGKGQRQMTPIPTLRRQLPELSKLLIRCLEYDVSLRPSLIEIQQEAESNIRRCESLQSEFPPHKVSDSEPLTADELDLVWSDEFC